MVNMRQISSSKKIWWEKIDDIAYTFVLTLPHQKLYMRNLKRENSHKEKSTMHLMCQYHPPKTPVGKNEWYDIILCWYCLIKNFTWETSRENSYKEKSAIWCLQQVINQRDSPPGTNKPQSKFIPMHSTYKKCGVWLTLWISLWDYNKT